MGLLTAFNIFSEKAREAVAKAKVLDPVEGLPYLEIITSHLTNNIENSTFSKQEMDSILTRMLHDLQDIIVDRQTSTYDEILLKLKNLKQKTK